MGIFDRCTQIWIAGIALGVVTITFGFWQMSWISPMAGFNLELLHVWLLFAAYVAYYNESRAWTFNLLGVSVVPLLAAVSLTTFFDSETTKTIAANLMGGFLLLDICPLLILTAFAMDKWQTKPDQIVEPLVS